MASGGRPLSEVSQSPALPSSTTPPGPVITAACPLLSARKVAATIHAGHVAVSHLAPVPKAFSCNYQAGARYIQLWISIVPATRTPQQAVSLAIRRYGGVLQAIPGLGDAASYTGPAGATAGPAVQTLVTARIEGHELRMITMVGFLSGNASRQLASLARSVLARV